MNWEVIRNYTEWGVVGATATGVIVDTIAHAGAQGTNPVYYPYRDLFPQIISEHIGNFRLSVLPVLFSGLASTYIDANGKVLNDQQLINLSRGIRWIGIVAAIGMNALFESQFFSDPVLMRENLMDFMFGMLATSLSVVAVKRLARYFERVQPMVVEV